MTGFMVEKGARLGLVAIMVSRLFYSLSWYNISPALIPISNTFGVPLSYMGIALSSFLIGAGVFQLPAGIISSRIGPRKTALYGLYLMSFAGIASSFSQTFPELVIFRFMIGVGAAFYFSTAMALINDLYPGNLTKMIGYYSAAFNIGAGAGIMLFTPVVSTLGWRFDFLSSGVALLVSTVVLQLTVRRTETYTAFDFHGIRTRMMDRRIWIIGLALVGLWALNYTVPEYFKTYATLIGINQFQAGIMGGLIPVAGIFGGILTGPLRKYNPVKLSAVLVIGIGTMVALIPVAPIAGMWLILAIVGIVATIVISLEFSIVAGLERNSRYIPINIGLLNSIQLGVGSMIPAIFGFVMIYGFSYSWLFLGSLAIVMMTLLVLLPGNQSYAAP